VVAKGNKTTPVKEVVSQDSERIKIEQGGEGGVPLNKEMNEGRRVENGLAI